MPNERVAKAPPKAPLIAKALSKLGSLNEADEGGEVGPSSRSGLTKEAALLLKEAVDGAGSAENAPDDGGGGGDGTSRPPLKGIATVGNLLTKINKLKGLPAKKKKEVEAAEAKRAEWMAEWKKWVVNINVPELVTEALQMPTESEADAFEYMRLLTREAVQELLEKAGLVGLLDHVMAGLGKVMGQIAPSGPALAEQYKTSAKFTMGFGDLSDFFNGLEALLGPPQMAKDPATGEATIFRAMEVEHCFECDSEKEFTSSNGVTTTSMLEWEFVVTPDLNRAERDVLDAETGEPTGAKLGPYPERLHLAEQHPEWCRKPRSREELDELLEKKANSKLREQFGEDAVLITEEFLAAVLYTGPMFQKYNAVLRSKTKDEFLVSLWKKQCGKNTYTTTIHAISSAVIKLSKLSKAGKVYRGVCYGRFPDKFWVADEMGVRGGVEFGFSSTTRERQQAVHYADGGGNAKSGEAKTILEMQMGMIDRGADIYWLSQYPHERECLLPPLTGIEVIGSEVQEDKLVIHSRLSLNLAADTLDQVLSRRRKMLMDMARGIELEIKEALKTQERLIEPATRILRKAIAYGALNQEPEWYNNDDNFAKVMQETLYLQRTLISEVKALWAAIELPDLNLKGWKATGPARVMLLAGWLLCRSSPVDVCIDLQQCRLTSDDGIKLAKLMKDMPKLASIDVRGNESLGEEGARALIDWLKWDKNEKTLGRKLRSLCGVGMGGSSRIDVPRSGLASLDAGGAKINYIKPVELSILCAELETNIFAEGVSAGMGGKGGGQCTSLNRRGHAGVGEWQPLVWAAKDNNLAVACKLLDTGTDVNLQEPLEDKGSSGYAALHWAAMRGFKEMISMLLRRGANLELIDKHGNTALMLAQKKGNKEVMALLTKGRG